MLTGDEDAFERQLEVIRQLARRCAGPARAGQGVRPHRHRLEKSCIIDSRLDDGIGGNNALNIGSACC
jgi:hypothetical protein